MFVMVVSPLALRRGLQKASVNANASSLSESHIRDLGLVNVQEHDSCRKLSSKLTSR